MVIDIYLKNEKEKIDFDFPVNPQDSLSIKKEKRFETVDIVNLGEFDIKKEGGEDKRNIIQDILTQFI
ncbi:MULTISPECIES: hypothetical protein [Clostridioides]|uniref:hypothetical protein n=1 Tax=Clostridioides sp. ZZV14-6387 TaxID=2811497 RepID=UPI0007BC4EB8|nr:hypothetical protein CDFC105_61582 [Clostridioides difficile]CZS05535.1 hypothetical protein CDFC105_71883 [Clostridioides difficile]